MQIYEKWHQIILTEILKKTKVDVSHLLISILQSLSVSQTNENITEDEPQHLHYTVDQMSHYVEYVL